MSDVTTERRDAVAAQLADELTVRLAESTAALLGTDLAELLRRRIENRAGPLIQSEDDRLSATTATATDVMHALWGAADPEIIEPDWWRTPLGRACARPLAHETSQSLTSTQTAAILGAPLGTVLSWVHRGQLDRHPDGGVSRSAVLQRLATRT